MLYQRLLQFFVASRCKSLSPKIIMIFHLIFRCYSQNVNCWSRCEFIRLRIQYGTKISKEIEYHSICGLNLILQYKKASAFCWCLFVFSACESRQHASEIKWKSIKWTTHHLNLSDFEVGASYELHSCLHRFHADRGIGYG